jgi:hypothetical protein
MVVKERVARGTYLIDNESRPDAKEVMVFSLRARVLVVLTVLLCGCPRLEEEGGDGVWHQCQPAWDEFSEMKSGDPCDFSGGCFSVWDTEPDAVPMARYVDCVNGALSVTDAYRIDEPAPNPDAHWEDCSALEGGVSGESCGDFFTCYEPEPSGCLMFVGCGASTATGLLVRYLLCDDESPEPPAVEATHTSCDSADGARPLDGCDGDFMCQGKYMESYVTVPACEELGGYCSAHQTFSWERLAWCSEDKLHVFNILEDFAWVILDPFDD